jgi:thiaminase (transcriptional activator TenA)
MKQRFTDELRIAAGDQWDRIIHHKFTKELALGTIDRDVLKRYLIQDHRFLDSFILLLASIIAKARTLQDRIPACQFLATITSTENTYFERCFIELNVSIDERSKVPNASCTDKFCALMQQVAFHGTLGEMLSVIVVCEWSYLSWGQIVQNDAIRNDFIMYEWIDLHTGPSFEHVVQYLRQLLDQEYDYLDEVDKNKCKERFLQAVQIEEEFFDFAYES